MHVQCPECFMTYDLDEMLRGKRGRCKECGAAIPLDEASWHVKVPPKQKPVPAKEPPAPQEPEYFRPGSGDAAPQVVRVPLSPPRPEPKRAVDKNDVRRAAWLIVLVYSLIAGPGTTVFAHALVDAFSSDKGFLSIMAPVYAISYLVSLPMWLGWKFGPILWHVVRGKALTFTFFGLVLFGAEAGPLYFLAALLLLAANFFGCLMLTSRELTMSGLVMGACLLVGGDAGVWGLIWASETYGLHFDGFN